MKMDIGSNFLVDEVAEAKEYSVATSYSDSIDHSLYPSAYYAISVGTVGSSGTIDMELQYSDDDSTWADYDGLSDDGGNDTNITQITAAGNTYLNVPNPLYRYSRVKLTVGTAASTLCVYAVAGPKKYVEAG